MQWQLQQLEKLSNALSSDEVLSMLNFGQEVLLDDMRRTEHHCRSLELPEHRLARGVLEGPKFQHWFAADEPSALMLESGPDLNILGRASALSYVSILVLEKLVDQEPAIAICHFCRRHLSSVDDCCGPQGMMRGLISQLLRKFPNLDLSFASSGRQFREQLESYHLDALCEFFRKVVERLPQDAVLFCIVDSVDCFERQEWVETCRVAMRGLQDMTHDFSAGATFKLLITSPVRSRYVSKIFTARQRVLLTGTGTSRDDPTERELERSGRSKRETRASGAWVPAGHDGISEDDLSDSDFSSISEQPRE
jgi:hypothetical protein